MEQPTQQPMQQQPDNNRIAEPVSPDTTAAAVPSAPPEIPVAPALSDTPTVPDEPTPAATVPAPDAPTAAPFHVEQSAPDAPEPWLPPREAPAPAPTPMPPVWSAPPGTPPMAAPGYPYAAPAWPTVPAVEMEPPLPAYREPDPDEDTTTPKMATASSPLNRARLLEVDNQTHMPAWPAVVSGYILLIFFALSAVSTVMDRSIPGGMVASAVCLEAIAVYTVFVAVGYFRRKKEQRRLVGFAALRQEQTGVIEVYADRAVKITPHTRTVVYFRHPQTTVWESPHTLTVSDGYAAIVWQAEDLTTPALEHLRRRVYPAIPPARRKSSGRMMALAETMAPLPDITLQQDVLTQFQYQPDTRRETDHRVGVLTAHTLPFNMAGAAVAGVLLSGLFPLPMPYPAAMAVYALLILLLAQGVTTGFLLWRQPQPQKITRGIAFTTGGIAVEENGCLRFIPHGWYKSLIKQDILALQTPVGQLCIPWQAVPDPELVKRLLTIGE